MQHASCTCFAQSYKYLGHLGVQNEKNCYVCTALKSNTIMTLSYNKIWLSAKDYIIITLGLTMYAFGFCAFVLPEKVVIGGVTGVSTIVYFVTQEHFSHGIPVAVTAYVVNAILLAIAWRKVGKTFVIRTIFGATVLSLGIGFFQPFFHEPIVKGQDFMNVLIGAIMGGFGVGLTYIHNGSTGGTDIVAAIVSKKSNVSFGRMMIYIDMCIIGSSYFIFHSIETTIYGVVFLFVVPMLADVIINTNRQAVQFTIISSHWKEIADAVLSSAHRGCTVLDGVGWYSKHDVKVLLVMCRRYESVTIFRIVKSIDEHAFIAQGLVNGVYGEGFDTIKLKLPKHPTAEEAQPTSRSHH